MNRRSFIRLFALGGAAAAAGAAVAHKETFESLLCDGQYRVSQSRNAIGTHVDIIAIGDSQMQAEDAVAAAFQDVASMERMLTRHGNASPVCELNAEGALRRIPPELAALYAACDFYHRETGGAFDITVKPVIDLIQKSANASRKPAEHEIAEALALVGENRIRLADGRISMPQGMGITLDGAAPGFIADRAAQILKNRGILNFLVNAGGEIRTSGRPQDANAWRVAIQDPKKSGNYPGFLAMNDSAVSTSGNYEIFYGNDKIFHHIVDARTGRCPDRVSVTVTAPTALEADILSTALFVMTPEDAVAYPASHPHVACMIIDRDGKRISSPNFVMA